MNIELAKKILKTCQENGVAEYCICAGARNSPFVFLLAKAKGANIYHFFEERSAAFFALGRMKFHQRPVAVVTTSGTAVAELLPATIEASYSNYPLVLITADRPRQYRKTGAPQSIEQVGIFSHYVETTKDVADLDESFFLDNWSETQPIHINVCFAEPLIDGEITEISISPAKTEKHPQLKPYGERKLKSPLIIVGSLKESERAEVLQFLKSTRAIIYAEGISGLRGDSELQDRMLKSGEKMAHVLIENNQCDSVLRIGGVPTLRFWRDLETKYSSVPVYSCSQDEFSGLSRSVRHLVGTANLHLLKIEGLSEASLTTIMERDLSERKRLEDLMLKYSLSEPSLIWQLSKNLAGQSVYLGNSLPIRHWDLVAPVDLKINRVEANRGANGIDGQVSTFLGWSEGDGSHWALLGDLTALYDLVAPWAADFLPSAKRRIVVINNGGGQIFKSIFKDKAFLNSHKINFKPWADLWGWDYQLWTEIPKSLVDLQSEKLIIELKPDNHHSELFWQETQESNTGKQTNW